MSAHKPLTRQEESTETMLAPEHILILHNDDHHTFDFVIDALVASCQHSPEQAEQCAFIVHFNGQCDVKRGSIEVIEKPYRYLVDKGLSVTIE